MTTLTLIVVVFCFLAVSTRAANERGISPYCRRARFNSSYGRVPIECCDHHGSCDKTIAPLQTKYGLKNENPQSIIRSCECDLKLWNCVMTDRLKELPIDMVNTYGFEYISCFRPSRFHQSKQTKDLEIQYEIVALLNVVQDKPQ